MSIRSLILLSLVFTSLVFVETKLQARGGWGYGGAVLGGVTARSIITNANNRRY